MLYICAYMKKKQVMLTVLTYFHYTCKIVIILMVLTYIQIGSNAPTDTSSRLRITYPGSLQPLKYTNGRVIAPAPYWVCYHLSISGLNLFHVSMMDHWLKLGPGLLITIAENVITHVLFISNMCQFLQRITEATMHTACCHVPTRRIQRCV